MSKMIIGVMRPPLQSRPFASPLWNRDIRIHHPDAHHLFAMGIIRAFHLGGTSRWGLHRERLFHTLIIVRRGRFAFREPQGKAAPDDLQTSQPSIFLPRPASYAFEAVGQYDSAPDGSTHEAIRLHIDPNLVEAGPGVRLLPQLLGQRLGDAFSGFAAAADEESERRQWAMAAFATITTTWEFLGLRFTPCADSELRMLLASIAESPDFPWTNAEIAAQLHCSPAHAGRRFHAAGLGSPMLEVHRIRMQRAERLLTFSSYDVAEIGRRCGFANQSSFSKAFSRHFGRSPRHFRKS